MSKFSGARGEMWSTIPYSVLADDEWTSGVGPIRGGSTSLPPQDRALHHHAGQAHAGRVQRARPRVHPVDAAGRPRPPRRHVAEAPPGRPTRAGPVPPHPAALGGAEGQGRRPAPRGHRGAAAEGGPRGGVTVVGLGRRWSAQPRSDFASLGVTAHPADGCEVGCQPPSSRAAASLRSASGSTPLVRAQPGRAAVAVVELAQEGADGVLLDAVDLGGQARHVAPVARPAPEPVGDPVHVRGGDHVVGDICSSSTPSRPSTSAVTTPVRSLPAAQCSTVGRCTTEATSSTATTRFGSCSRWSRYWVTVSSPGAPAGASTSTSGTFA